MELENFIGGEFVHVGDGETSPIVDPADGSLIASVPRATQREVEQAITSAAKAFRSWASTTPSARSRTLLEVAERLAERVDEFAELEMKNVGMPRSYAAATIEGAVDCLRFFAGAARMLEGRAASEYAPGITSFIRREPLGVVAQLLAWNVPLLMAAWKLGPALAAGNTVVMKPSQRTPLSLLRLCELAGEIVPPGVLNVVTGSHGVVGHTLFRHPQIRMVAITGSVAAGIEVSRQAADSIKRLHLELGGKTPVIVLDDADLDRAAGTIVRGALDNSGQDCTAASRVLVETAAHDQLVELLDRELREVRVGHPADPDTDMGPVIGDDRRTQILGQIERAASTGARVVAGGAGLPGPGFFLSPALLTEVQADSEIACTEIFGPVITVERVADEAEALARANALPYGLAAGIWTRSLDRGLRLGAEIEAGKVWINEHHRDATEMPHGGVKHSGYGSDLSLYALEDYTALKSLHIRIRDDEGSGGG